MIMALVFIYSISLFFVLVKIETRTKHVNQVCRINEVVLCRSIPESLIEGLSVNASVPIQFV